MAKYGVKDQLLDHVSACGENLSQVTANAVPRKVMPRGMELIYV